MKLSAGTILGRYELLAEIGRGGMGVVYRARDPKIDRLVAIKTISLLGQEPEDEREYRERFVLEARAAGRLSHPSIITIFDVGEEPENHDPYIVMEYVAGESLRKLLAAENKKIPLASALQLTQGLAEALHYAHSQGVIHRDIKPSNILVTPGYHAKIADFGIAKLNLAHLTLPGQLLGSPAYMSPEQLSGEGVDARSDLFSLGVILYTMITGYRPFQGNSATTVCFKVVNRDPVPVSAFDADLPRELDEIIVRAMAKDPAERYQSGAEMALAIEIFRANKGLLQNDSSGTSTRNTAHAIRTSTGTSKTQSRSSSSRLGNASKQGRAAVWKEIRDRAYVGLAILFLGVASFALYRSIFPAFHESAVPTPPTTRTEKPAAAANMSVPASVQSASVQSASVQSASVQSSNAPPVAANSPVRVLKANAKPVQRVTPNAEPATMQIEIEHPFAAAEASVWLDNQLVYTHPLHGESRTRAVVFRHIQGHQSDSVQVPAGEHRVHVRIQSIKDSYDQSKTLSGIFQRSGENVLHVKCDKHGGTLDVTLQ